MVRYDSSHREVRVAKLGSMATGYVCPVCGMTHCHLEHCMLCGTPLVYEERQLEDYRECFKSIDEECKILDERNRKGGYNRNPFTGEKEKTLTELRKQLLKEYPNVVQSQTIYRY